MKIKILVLLVLFFSVCGHVNADVGDLDVYTAVRLLTANKKPVYVKTEKCWEGYKCQQWNFEYEAYKLSKNEYLIWRKQTQFSEHWYYFKGSMNDMKKELDKIFDYEINDWCEYYSFRSCVDNN